MKPAVLLNLCAAALLVTGCAGTRQFVTMPDQSKSVEDPSKGRIYLMRPASIGTAVSMNVGEDGKPIGVTGAHGFLCWERAPGDSIISSTAEGVSQLPLTVDAGHIYYVVQHVRMGVWMARSELQLVSDEEGTKTLKHCHPAQVEAQQRSAVAAGESGKSK
jgi:hypothetical protein